MTIPLNGNEDVLVEYAGRGIYPAKTQDIANLVQQDTQSPVITNFTTFGAIGDSITANNGSVGGASYYNTGYATWWKVLSGQRAYFVPSLNLGVSGNTLAQMLTRVPTLLAASPTFCFFLGGSNDAVNGRTFAQMQSDTLAILQPIVNAGIPIVWLPILPRTAMSAAVKLVRAQYNTWVREIGFGRTDLIAALGCTAVPRIIVTDPTPALEDFTTGEPISTMFQDGTHPNSLGAYTIGKQIDADISSYFLLRKTTMTDFADYWTTTNTTGNLFFTGTTNYGLLQGTGGAKTVNSGITPTGNVATGCQIYMSGSSASGVTLVGSKQNPRTDGTYTTGERQIITYHAGGSGGADEIAVFANTNNMGNYSVGDSIYAECSYTVGASPLNFTGIELICQEFPIGNGTDCAVVTQSNHQALPAHSGVLRTPPYTIVSSLNQLSIKAQMHFDTTLGATGGDGVITIGDFQIRKLS